MIQLFTKKDGAVTVFLVMILVPVITVASVFVDASRIRMAQSVASTATDLTLEAILAKYDAELNDYYGLMASCQNVDEFLEKTNDILVSAMTSQGISSAAANDLISAVADYTGDNSVDLLQMALAEDSGTVVTKIDGANLTDGAIVKKEIADFMKYRAPINLAGDLIEKLTKQKEKIKEAQIETDLVDKKNDFYIAANALMEKAYDIYEAREAYIKAFNGMDMTTYFQNMKTAMQEGKYRKTYEEQHQLLVKNLYNSEGILGYNMGQITQPAEYNITTYNSKNKPSNNVIASKLLQLKDCYVQMKNAYDNLESREFLPHSNGNYSVQYWIQTRINVIGNSNHNVLTRYSSVANDLTKCYAEFVNMTDYAENGYEDFTFKETILGPEYTVENFYKNFKEDLESMLKKLNLKTPTGQQTKYYIEASYLADCSDTSKTKTDSVNSAISEIYKELDGYLTTLKTAEKNAASIVEDCKGLKKLIQDYEDKLGIWEQAAEDNKNKSELAKKDLTEIEKETLDEIDKAKVLEMQEKFEEIDTLLKQVIEDIESYTYGSGKKKICEIKNFEDFKSASKLSEDRIVVNEKELDQYVEESFYFTEPESLALDTINKSNHPDVEKYPTEFEDWLVARFADVVPEELENAEEELDNIEEQGEDKAKEESDQQQDSSGNEISEMDNLPSENNGTDSGLNTDNTAIKNANNSLSSILLDDLSLENNLERIYAIDYIMSMFSYDTYVYEGMNKNAKALGCSDGTPETITAAQELHNNSNYQNAWKQKESDVTFTANKTLTNKVINATNNYAFGSEVEYILYGGTNAANKVNAYARIYCIRYALNTPAIFKIYWNNKHVNEIATLISGATEGIIPVALVKLAIMLLLIAFESAIDLAMLKEGLPVAFIKDKESIYINPDNVLDNKGKLDESKTSPDEASEKENVLDELNSFYYSTYLQIFLFVKMSTGGEETVYQRIADVIQANMRQVTGKTGYVMSNSQVYYQLKADIDVPPLMLKLPINSGDWDDLVNDKYTIHFEAVKGY